MLNFYVDEKGPQESYKKETSKEFIDKLKYGDDNMHDYVGATIKIEDNKKKEIESSLIKLENKFKRIQMKGKELKGKDIVKNKIFKYGIASMKPKEVKFYTDLLNLLIKENIQPCIYIINKMSYLVSSKLRNWILLVSDCEQINPYILKFIFTGYLEIESKPDDIEALLNKNMNIYHTLKIISKNLRQFIRKNKNNYRMLDSQIPAYKQLLKYINKYKNYDSNIINFNNPSFNWQIISQMFDLWLTEILEQDTNARKQEVSVYLDEGIKRSIFDKIQLVDHVYDNQHSSKVPEIRIADYLVVIYGKLLQLLVKDSQYDRASPQTQKLIVTPFFDINEGQFNLLKLLYKLIFNNNYHYSVMKDCYYKDEVRLESYLRYFNNFRSFKQFCNIDCQAHRNNENNQLITILKETEKECNVQYKCIRYKYSSMRKAFDDNILVQL